MPTPSNNPPPQLPPSSRPHGSTTCPEEPRSWRPSEQDNSHRREHGHGHGHGHDIAMQMHAVDREAESASPDPEPVSAPTTHRSDAMVEDDATTVTMDSRSNTASPRPESRSVATPSSTAGTADTEVGDDDEDSIHHNKPMEVEGSSSSSNMAAVGGDADTSSARRIQERQSQSQQQQPVSQQQQQRQRKSQTNYDMPSHSHKPEDGFVQQAAAVGYWDDGNCTPSMGYEYSNVRILPTTPSSFLRPGSRFHGTQQSERQVYDVQVEIKYVDFRESFLCGYLKIQGLTEDNPTLTTYFEGEIIGSKYGFLTQHPSWGATEKIDMNHWSKFTAFRQYRPAMRAMLSSSHQKPGTSSPSDSNNNTGPGPGPGIGPDGVSAPAAAVPATTTKAPAGVLPPTMGQRENIFMRWKEHFLVPDHRVRTINGASFEGFYYICFNQKKGKVDGIYFHSKSEKFQELSLHHVEDKGCFAAMEFR